MSVYVRWWWFFDHICEKDIDDQLQWIKDHNFDGIEIAWMYANKYLYNENSTNKNKHTWLSDELKKTIKYTKDRSNKLGLFCDFSYGSSWPLSSYSMSNEYASKTFQNNRIETSKQRVIGFWQDPFEDEPPFVLDHLDRNALREYSNIMNSFLLEKSYDNNSTRLFYDSWEVDCDKLWKKEFDKLFLDTYGYDIKKFMINLSSYPMCLYDYRKLISRIVIEEFYSEFTRICHENNVESRVQCHGSPTDLLHAYSVIDVPESESLLFPPEFSRIAASAATLMNKKLVSAETFTCIYGFKPALHMRDENVFDLKLLVDGLIANGINMIVWHGMPYKGNEFYATVYVGENGTLERHLVDFNGYIRSVCEYMSQGVTYHDIAIYLPIEDSWINYEYPDDLKCPGGMYYYDLRYVKPPNRLNGYHPIWISGHFLKDFSKYGFKSLYVDVKWLEQNALDQLLILAEKGVIIFVNNQSKQPGYIKDVKYDSNFKKLISYPNVHTKIDPFLKTQTKLVDVMNDTKLFYWCKVIDDTVAYIFFAHPKCVYVKYPMKYNMSSTTVATSLDVAISIFGNTYRTILTFEPNQSILVKVCRDDPTKIEHIDISMNIK